VTTCFIVLDTVQDKVHQGICSTLAIPQGLARCILAAAGQAAQMEASSATSAQPRHKVSKPLQPELEDPFPALLDRYLAATAAIMSFWLLWARCERLCTSAALDASIDWAIDMQGV